MPCYCSKCERNPHNSLSSRTIKQHLNADRRLLKSCPEVEKQHLEYCIFRTDQFLLTGENQGVLDYGVCLIARGSSCSHPAMEWLSLSCSLSLVDPLTLNCAHFVIMGLCCLVLGRPSCCGILYLCIRLLLSSSACVTRRWAAHVVVEWPTSRLGSSYLLALVQLSVALFLSL